MHVGFLDVAPHSEDKPWRSVFPLEGTNPVCTCVSAENSREGCGVELEDTPALLGPITLCAEPLIGFGSQRLHTVNVSPSFGPLPTKDASSGEHGN